MINPNTIINKMIGKPYNIKPRIDKFSRNNKNLELTGKSVNMPQLVECQICGSNTRYEWTLKDKVKNKTVGYLWACSYHDKDVIWNKILSQK